jgi:RNA polymerase sigma-70 factor (ECF subfamily)
MDLNPNGEVSQLYREHRDRLWRAVFLFAGDREVATDAVSEAFAQALRRGAGISAILPWVWRAAFRIAAGELKERSRMISQPSPSTYEVPSEALALAEALAKLPPGQRAASILHYYADYSLQETAAVLGSTVPAVGMQLTRARRRLRELLEERDG